MAASGKLPLGRGARLITSHPAGLWAVAKPAGVRSHPNTARADSGALLTVAYDAKAQCYSDGAQNWFLLHRLDGPTSGVVLLADNAALARLIKGLFADRRVEKTYVVVVHGKPRRREDLWKDRLETERRGRSVRTRAGAGPLAIATMKSLKVSTGAMPLSLLELQPQTGRTHQLRIQCAERQLPIVGDATYGDFRLNRRFVQEGGPKRLFLHAQRVRLRFEWEGKPVRFHAEDPLPAAFSEAVG